MSPEQEERFEKLDEAIFKNYRLTMAIGVAISIGLLAFAMGGSAKASAVFAFIGLAATEIETIYEIRKSARAKED